MTTGILRMALLAMAAGKHERHAKILRREEEKQKMKMARETDLALRKNGGSDVIRDPKRTEFDDPGLKELRKSARFISRWKDVDDNELYMLIPTGKRPSTFSESTEELLKRNADWIIRSDKLSFLRPVEGDLFDPLADRLAASIWLEVEMKQLGVVRDFADQLMFFVGRQMALPDTVGNWRLAVTLRNGFVRTVCELRQHYGKNIEYGSDDKEDSNSDEDPDTDDGKGEEGKKKKPKSDYSRGEPTADGR